LPGIILQGVYMNKLYQGLIKSGLAVAIMYSGAASADGFYIGAGAYESRVSVTSVDDDDVVPAAFLGYQFLDTNFLMLSAELGYYDLGSYSGTDYKVDSDALTLAGVVYVPIGPFFEVYAKAGVSSISGDTVFADVKKDYDSTDAFGGVGFSFDILDTVDIYAEYLAFDNELDSEVVGVGVRFDFF
jgi:hypothetical protein